MQKLGGKGAKENTPQLRACEGRISEHRVDEGRRLFLKKSVAVAAATVLMGAVPLLEGIAQTHPGGRLEKLKERIMRIIGNHIAYERVTEAGRKWLESGKVAYIAEGIAANGSANPYGQKTEVIMVYDGKDALGRNRYYTVEMSQAQHQFDNRFVPMAYDIKKNLLYFPDGAGAWADAVPQKIASIKLKARIYFVEGGKLGAEASKQKERRVMEMIRVDFPNMGEREMRAKFDISEPMYGTVYGIEKF